MSYRALLKKGLCLTLVALMGLPVGLFAQEAQAQPPASSPEYAIYRTIIERAKAEGKSREMTLADCIDQALRKNLGIEINHYQPLMSKEAIKAAMGVYDFNLTGGLSYTKTENPITDKVTREVLGLDTFRSNNYNFKVGLSRYFQTGATVSLSFDNDRNVSNTDSTTPMYSGVMTFNLSQPLWKNFRLDANRRAIIMAKKDQQISDIDFENQISTIVKTVEDTYWDLVNAIEQQNIQIQSRELAIIQLRDNQKRVEVGTLAPIIITQTKAQVAQAEQSVIAAEASIIQFENLLKFLTTNDPKSDIWDKIIIPTDRPVVSRPVPSTEEAIQYALSKRPEVRRLNITLEKNDIDLGYYKNQAKPRLDLTAYYSTTGTAGPNVKDIIYDENGNVISSLPNKFTGRFGAVYGQVFRQEFPNYMIGLSFQYAIGNRTARATLATVNLERGQNEATMKQTIQTIQTEVINAIQTIEVNRKSMESAAAARRFQEEQLDGQTKRFQAGLTTNFEVLQTQRDLATARGAELQANIALRKAVVNLQRATFTLLDQNKLDIVYGR